MQRQTIFKSLAQHYGLLYLWKEAPIVASPQRPVDTFATGPRAGLAASDCTAP